MLIRRAVLAFLVVLALTAACTDGNVEGGQGVVLSPLRVDTLIATASGHLGSPSSVAVAPDGAVWISDRVRHRLLKISPEGEFEPVGREGRGPGEFVRPEAVAYGDSALRVLDFGNRRVQTLSLDGVPAAQTPVSGPMYLPLHLSPTGGLATPALGAPPREALVVVYDGAGGSREYGNALAPWPPGISVSALRNQVQRGVVPEEFQNNVLPVARMDGGVWIVSQVTGAVWSFDSDGVLEWENSIPERIRNVALERFFEDWATEPVQVHVPWIARAGAELDGALWVLADGPNDDEMLLMRFEPSDGDLRTQAYLPFRPPAGCLFLQRVPDQIQGHVCLREEAAVVRFALPLPNPA